MSPAAETRLNMPFNDILKAYEDQKMSGMHHVHEPNHLADNFELGIYAVFYTLCGSIYGHAHPHAHPHAHSFSKSWSDWGHQGHHPSEA